MSQNQSQGQPPAAPIAAGRSREELRGVAVKQKGVILGILCYFLLILLALAMRAAPDVLPLHVMRLLILVWGAAASIVAVVFVFMLGIKLYGTAIGIIFGLLTILPFVGMIFLLIVNAKATRTLRAGGFKVGFFGASLSQFEVMP